MSPRDLWFYGTLGALTAAVTPTSLLTVLATGNGDLGQRLHARTWARALLALNGKRLEVRGLERIDPRRAHVIVANHPHPVALLALPASLPVIWRMAMRGDLARLPIFGLMARAGGQVLLDLRTTESAIASLATARPLLDRGVSVIVFPEGRRTESGLAPLKTGAFHLARAARVPLLPVRLDLAGRTVRITFHDPLPTEGVAVPTLVEQARAALRAQP